MKKSRASIQNLNPPRDRRSFLKTCGVLGLGGCAGGAIQLMTRVVKVDGKRYRVSASRLAMGTTVSLTLFHRSRSRAERALDAAFVEIARLEALLTRHKKTSVLSKLNSTGRMDDAPAELLTLLKQAQQTHRLTGGAFDISVKPLVDLFKTSLTTGDRQPPSPLAFRRAMKLVDANRITVSGRSIRLELPGMGLTLDGIAKGYIVDRTSELLLRYGIRDHLINAGGDIRTSGSRDGHHKWRIAVQDPGNKTRQIDRIIFGDGAVATSGSYEIFYDKKRVYHHIVDPGSGICPGQHVSVSVVAPTVMQADALSTAVFVMEGKSGAELVAHTPGVECLAMARDGGGWRSAGWKSA